MMLSESNRKKEDMMDYDKAAEYWLVKDKDALKMDREKLKVRIDEFLGKHKVCALAVADGDFVRCTPLEYTYYRDALWIFSEGGLKFKGLKNNKHVCIAVYEEHTEFGNLAGMQITGMAEIIEPWSDVYTELVEYKKYPVKVLKNLPQPMNLIKITPQVIDFLSSDMKKAGFNSRQQYTF